MTSPGAAARASKVQFQAKATLLRGQIDSLRMHGLYDVVYEHLQPSSQRLLVSPPASTSWIDGRVIMEVQDVVYDLRGEDVMAAMQVDAVRKGVSPLLRSAAESVVRLFGVSPATLFSRMQQLAGTTTRGVTYRYKETSSRSGIFDLSYDTGTDVPLSAFLSGRTGFATIFEFLDIRGTIVGPEILPDGRRASARFLASW